MTELAKAQLIELDADFKNEKPGGQKVSVQFNPETLKVSFANQLVQPQGGDQAAGIRDDRRAFFRDIVVEFILNAHRPQIEQRNTGRIGVCVKLFRILWKILRRLGEQRLRAMALIEPGIVFAAVGDIFVNDWSKQSAERTPARSRTFPVDLVIIPVNHEFGDPSVLSPDASP